MVYIRQITNNSIADAFIKHYKNLSNVEKEDTLWISNLDWSLIDPKHHNILCATFNEFEIKKAIASLGNGKAPGPDGFTVLFFKKC